MIGVMRDSCGLGLLPMTHLTCDTVGCLEHEHAYDLAFHGVRWADLRTNPGP